MAFFTTWIIPIICLGIAYYLYKNPIDDKNPLIYLALLIICLAVKTGNFAERLAERIG